MFDKVDGFIRDCNGTKYLVLLGPPSSIFDRIKYLIELKSGISYVTFCNYLKIKIDSDDDLLLEKTLSLCNVVILIELVFNKNHN